MWDDILQFGAKYADVCFINGERLRLETIKRVGEDHVVARQYSANGDGPLVVIPSNAVAYVRLAKESSDG